MNLEAKKFLFNSKPDLNIFSSNFCCYLKSFTLSHELKWYNWILWGNSPYVNYFGFSIAVYFEGERNHLQSGRFYYRAGEHSKVSWDGGR